MTDTKRVVATGRIVALRMVVETTEGEYVSCEMPLMDDAEFEFTEATVMEIRGIRDEED